MTKYTIKYLNSFKKDVKKLVKQGKNLNKLYTIISKIANDETLEEKYCNHKLTGVYTGHMECHIEPDWLLVYIIEKDILVVTLTRSGSHSELF